MSETDHDAGFDWTSPRWRDGAPDQHATERDRRRWDRCAPAQSGAIDAGRSVPRGREASGARNQADLGQKIASPATGMSADETAD